MVQQVAQQEPPTGAGAGLRVGICWVKGWGCQRLGLGSQVLGLGFQGLGLGSQDSFTPSGGSCNQMTAPGCLQPCVCLCSGCLGHDPHRGSTAMGKL